MIATMKILLMMWTCKMRRPLKAATVMPWEIWQCVLPVLRGPETARGRGCSHGKERGNNMPTSAGNSDDMYTSGLGGPQHHFFHHNSHAS